MDELLAQLYKDYTDTKFKYGSIDCLRFCADWVLRVTGVDYRGEIPEDYTTEAEAYSALEKHGFKGTTELVDSLFTRVKKRRAKRGSLVSIKNENGLAAIGVYTGEVGLFLMQKGLKAIPRDHLDIYWDIK